MAPPADLSSLVDSDPAVLEVQTRAAGPSGSLPLTEDLLRNAPSGDLFGWTMDVGMGWNPAELARLWGTDPVAAARQLYGPITDELAALADPDTAAVFVRLTAAGPLEVARPRKLRPREPEEPWRASRSSDRGPRSRSCA